MDSGRQRVKLKSLCLQISTLPVDPAPQPCFHSLTMLSLKRMSQIEYTSVNGMEVDPISNLPRCRQLVELFTSIKLRGFKNKHRVRVSQATFYPTTEPHRTLPVLWNPPRFRSPMNAPPWDQHLDIGPDLATSCTNGKQVYGSKEPFSQTTGVVRIRKGRRGSGERRSKGISSLT